MISPTLRRVPVGSAFLALLLAAILASCAPATVPSPGSPTVGAPATAPSIVSTPPTNAGPPPPACPPAASPSASTGAAGRSPSATDGAWWLDRVFYEVFVRSFADSDRDGVGDLRGLIGRLDYLNDGDPETDTDLGVTGLWLMPTFPSPSYHGYDVTDFQSVNPDYGSLEDMRALVGAAHQRGIAVLLDLPINHTSDRHPWFLDSRKPGSAHADWYVWSDTPLGSNWHPDGKRVYYGAFGADMPDLDLRNPKVTAQVTAAAAYWIDTAGVDGFRIDAAKHLLEDFPATENSPGTLAWLAGFRRTLQRPARNPLLVGEVWDTSPISASYVPDSLDMTFDFTVASSYVSAVGGGDGANLDRILARVTTLYPTGGFGAFLTNHDMDRVASQLTGDQDRLRLAASLLLTGPGVPFVYYGEEIGMTGVKPDERIRTPMRWDASEPAAGFSSHAPWEALSADDPATTNVATEAADPGSLWSTYRDLIALRAGHPALSGGTYVPVTSDSSAVVAAIRSSPAETALVIANVSDQPAAPNLSLTAGPLCGAPKGAIVLGADEGAASAPGPSVTPDGGFTGYRPVAEIPARSVVIIVLTP